MIRLEKPRCELRAAAAAAAPKMAGIPPAADGGHGEMYARGLPSRFIRKRRPWAFPKVLILVGISWQGGGSPARRGRGCQGAGVECGAG